ncbi:hypothetical protein TNCV_4388351 [Trichonephila clavipes]|nr:hypothetical protein TNCV_4388351 [Trichonephila clavipes]
MKDEIKGDIMTDYVGLKLKKRKLFISPLNSKTKTIAREKQLNSAGEKQLDSAPRTKQLDSAPRTKQLDSTGGNNSTRQQERNNSTLHCRRLPTTPPAPPLQQNRLFLPTYHYQMAQPRLNLTTIKVVDSWLVGHVFDPCTTEVQPCRKDRCLLNMARLKRLHGCVVSNLGKGGATQVHPIMIGGGSPKI